MKWYELVLIVLAVISIGIYGAMLHAHDVRTDRAIAQMTEWRCD